MLGFGNIFCIVSDIRKYLQERSYAIMASASDEPPNRGGLKMYKCHPNTPVKTVVCVYCEDTYHVSDFNSKFKLKNEQRPLVVCPDHNLTFKIGDHVLTVEVKMVIAQIKAAKEEQIKEQILKEVMENSNLQIMIAKNTKI